VQAGQDEITQQYRVFTAALEAIDREYVEEVPSDRLVYGGIEGMLKTLDPHSSFLDPRQYADMRQKQEGRYYGLGISINVIDGDITYQEPIQRTPSRG
jgi:carboxyl-terminal processing protease